MRAARLRADYKLQGAATGRPAARTALLKPEPRATPSLCIAALSTVISDAAAALPPRTMRRPMARVALLAALGHALQPCSTPLLIDGEATVVECGGPHAVEAAVFGFLASLNDTQTVGCSTNACVEAARPTAKCDASTCVCGAADWACARLVVEHAALAARWPPVTIANVQGLCAGRAPVNGEAGTRVLIASATDRVRVAAHTVTNLADATWAAWRVYCRKHGYAFFPLDLSKERVADKADALHGAPGAHVMSYAADLKVELDYYLKVRSGHWHKIFLLRQLLEAPCFEFYVVVDDDVVVTDVDQELASLLGELPPDYLGAGADQNYHQHSQAAVAKGYSFNTGLLATRGGEYAKLLLEASWLEPFREDGNTCWLKECFAWDQAAVASLHGRVGAVHVFSYRVLQSFWNAHVCAPDFFAAGCSVENSRLAWRPGDFAAHLSGGHYVDRSHRLSLLREYMDEGTIAFGNVTVGLAVRRTALLELAVDACGRDRVADPARRAVDEVCDKIDRTGGFPSMARSVLWPTVQLRAAVAGLYASPGEAEVALADNLRALLTGLQGIEVAVGGVGFYS